MGRYWLMILATSMALTACGGAQASEPVENSVTDPVPEQVVTVEQPPEPVNEVAVEEPDNVVEEASQESTEGTTVEEEPIEEEAGPFAPLTGLPSTDETIEKRAMAVMLDNYFRARPQAGLGQADVVYEILAEGNITRYMAIFHTGAPETIGPIRSARPYFIDKALEYDPYYVHVGGSMQALTDVIVLNMADVDGLSSGSNVFWRTSHKKIPHNMYASDTSLRKEANRRGHRVDIGVDHLTANSVFRALESGSPAEHVLIRYKKPTTRDKVGYYSEWTWDEEIKMYRRSVNGKPHVDETTKEALTAANVLIQAAKHKVIDNEGRLSVALIGEGSGWFLTGGEKIPVTWKKSDRRDVTRFYDESGTEIVLNPGVTWYQVIPTDLKLGW